MSIDEDGAKPISEAVARELEVIKEGILQAVPAEAIYLFGSYAYGTPHEASDLDIYVVVPDDVPRSPVEICGEINHDLYVCRKLTRSMDIVVGRSSAFHRRKLGPTLQRTIAQKGVLLHGS